MRVLLLNHFPLEGSGSGTYTKNLAAVLAAAGHKVKIIFPENTADYELPPGVEGEAVYFTREETIPGALPFNFPCFTSHPRSTLTFYEMTAEQRGAYVGAFDRALARAVEEFRPDLVHAQHIWVWPCLAARRGLPLVTTVHGTDLMGFEKNDKFWCAMAKEAVAGSARLITISKDSDALTAAAFPESEGKRVLMSNGYDAHMFYPEPVDRQALAARYGLDEAPEKLVFFAGKLTGFKGVDVLLDAAALYEEAPGAPVTLIAGDGEKRGELEARARELGLRRVYFLGNRPQQELRGLYSAADVAAVPSRREPFGLVALEAMACGTPVIASNEGGLPDFVTEEAGALVPPGDAAALARAVVRELSRRDHGARCQAAALYARTNYAGEDAVPRLEALYQTVLDEHRLAQQLFGGKDNNSYLPAAHAGL